MSSIIYVFFFIYVILHNNPTLFYLFTSMLIMGSILEVIKFKKMPFKNIVHIFLIIYITTSLLILIKIKLIEHGEVLLFILLSQIWASDLGGYLIGSFGKYHFSQISPNKTYEGLIGSVIFCVTTGLIAQALTPSYVEIKAIKTSCIICVSSILGDLIMSKIKRLNHKQNSGFFLPGHGGFIDRLDSLFLATPIYYLSICI